MKNDLANRRGSVVVENLLMLSAVVGVILIVGVAMKEMMPGIFKQVETSIAGTGTDADHGGSSAGASADASAGSSASGTQGCSPVGWDSARAGGGCQALVGEGAMIELMNIAIDMGVL